MLAGGDDNIDSDFEQKDEQEGISERKREQKMKKKTEDRSFMKTSNEYTKIGKLVSYRENLIECFSPSKKGVSRFSQSAKSMTMSMQ